ncbi:MAG: hypothetical protein ABI480_03250 [Chitinophagaceae bacterium]
MNRNAANRTMHNAGTDHSFVSLQLLVNHFLGKCMTEAFRTKSVIVNNVPRDIRVSRSNAIVAPVIRELLNTVARNARNGDIIVAAERFRNTIILKIQDRNNYNGYALTSSLLSLESDALMVEGNITVEGAQQKVVTVSFSFPGDSDDNECNS